MYKILLTLIFIALPLGVHAECTPPEPPQIPDAETTVTAEMIKAQNDVKAFLAEAEAYLKCTDDTLRYNKMVNKMKDIGKEFNDALKAYKARLKNQ